MHWTERSNAKVTMAENLQAHGWTLYGYHVTKGDPMTDYAGSSSWDGIAEKDGFVFVMDLSSDYPDSPLAKVGRIGEKMMTRMVKDKECVVCKGTGIDPGGWTLEKARENPRQYHAETTAVGAIALFPDVVSPLPFREDGKLRCKNCSEGWRYKSESYTVTWPHFRTNPPHRLWHLEKDGRILVSGVGLSAINKAAYGQYPQDPATNTGAEAIRLRLERAMGHIPGTETENTEGARDRYESGGPIFGDPDPVSWKIWLNEKGNIEVEFSGKPSVAIRSGLKSYKLRWHNPSKLWWAKNLDMTINFAPKKRFDAVLSYLRRQSEVYAEQMGAKVPEPETIPLVPARWARVSGIEFEREVTEDGIVVFTYLDEDRSFVWSAWQKGGDGSEGNPMYKWHTSVLNTPKNRVRSLHNEIDDTIETEPPFQILESLANLIKSGHDPFNNPNRQRSITSRGQRWVFVSNEHGTYWNLNDQYMCYRAVCEGIEDSEQVWKGWKVDLNKLHTNDLAPFERNGSQMEERIDPESGDNLPLNLIADMTDVIMRGNIVIKKAELLPREDGGWDYMPLDDEDHYPTPEPVHDLVQDIVSLGNAPEPEQATGPVQLSLF